MAPLRTSLPGFLVLVLIMSASPRSYGQAVHTAVHYDAAAAALKVNIIRHRTNLFADRIPLHPAERQWRRAEADSRALPGNLPEYYAVYYIFPPDGNPMTFTGVLMPASEELASVHLASMLFRPDEKSVARLAGLSPSTIVYATDRSGNRAWWPLRFFRPDEKLDGYLSAEGLYAYTYRPSAKLRGRYGNTAFYLDILDPALVESARVIPEENITIVTDNVPDEIVRVAQFSRAVLLNRLVPLLDRFPEYGAVPYEVAIIDPPAKAGSIELRLPVGVRYRRSGDTLSIAPAPAIFAALEEFRTFIISELYSAGMPDHAAAVAGYELSVSHYNDAGEIDMLRVPGDSGEMVWCPEVFLRPAGEQVFLRVQDFDEDNTGDGIYVFVRGGGEPDSDGLFDFLEEHIATSGVDRWPPFVRPDGEDWTAVYDTVKYGIGKLARPRTPVRDDSKLPYVPHDRLFELDLLPDFYGKGVEGFAARIYDEIGRTGIGGLVVCDFIVGTDGRMYAPEIVDCTDWALAFEVMKHMALGYLWTPGEISGFPVNVQLRLSLDYRE